MATVGKDIFEIEDLEDHSITRNFSNIMKNKILYPDKINFNQSIYSNYSIFDNKMNEEMREFKEKMKEVDSYGEIISIQDAFEHGKQLMNKYEQKWELYKKKEAERLTLFLEEKDEEEV